jgi:NitT/TauT family transport system substrate-binding protein
MRTPKLTRRAVLSGAAATMALACPAIAQQRAVNFTLPWLAEGNYIYLIGGKAKGIFAKHGIDISISRGFGSLAAGQAIASGQFEFGTKITTPLILLNAKGLPLVSLATMDYDAGMGVGVLGDSPITKPSMLDGRKVGEVPTSAEFPFFPAYAKKAGIDVKSIQFVNTDNKVLERVLSEKQVDAMTGIASSSLPIFISKNIPIRWMLYSSAGLPSYGTGLTTTQDTLSKERSLCEAMTQATCECLAYSLTQPEEATELFLKAMPEMALNPGSKEFLRIGMGLHDYVVAKPEAKDHGLGYSDPATLKGLVDLVMDYVATPEMKRPEVATWYHGDFAGKVTLTKAQWTAVDERVSEFGKLLA